MKKAIVSVGFGEHNEIGIKRLARSLDRSACTDGRFFYKSFPHTWPKHEDVPFAFKPYSLMETSWQADMLLWCDSSVIALRSLDPLWERIERDGYWFCENMGFNNYQCTEDSAYEYLFPGVPIDEARETNKQIPHVVATAFGLNLGSEIGTEFLTEYYRLSKTRAFCGTDYRAREGKPLPEQLHRHDQTAASVIAWKLGMNLTQWGEVLSDMCHTRETLGKMAGKWPNENVILLIDRGHEWLI